MHSHYNTTPKTFKGKNAHLTLNDRRHIQRWHDEGFSNRKIAQLLNKAPQTIHNEIKRGMVRQQVRKGVFVMVYRADFAHQRYLENRRNCVRPRKLDAKTKETLVYFMTTMKYSPEMIVGRKIVNVSVSTIYYWIHHGHIGLSPKDLLYPRKNKVLRKKQSENFRIKGKSIECRPDNINKRLEPGHY
ncbi:transposase, partial [Tuanshanicoccus yangjingiae]|uniref:transposase n=1 Tax=Aerococcaceae bacterium zg-252 TaxID=2796928 RepID=UPI004062FDB3